MRFVSWGIFGFSYLLIGLEVLTSKTEVGDYSNDVLGDVLGWWRSLSGDREFGKNCFYNYLQSLAL